MYLTTSRIEIMQEICMVARFQADPKEYHVNAVKIIFRYIKSTIYYGQWYPKSNNFTSTTYIDVDQVGYANAWNSTSGGAFFLEDKLVSWMCKK